MYMKNLALSLIALFIAGCASTPPAEQITQAPENDISIAEVYKDVLIFKDSVVRWGGRILKVTEAGTDTNPFLKIEILEYPLDEKGKPMESAGSGGRFITQINSPYKKSSFFRGRLITVSGLITGKENYALASGEKQSLPVVQSNEKYAWRRPMPDSYYDPWYGHVRYGFHNRPYYFSTGYGIIFY
jgi:outer membrane lipoprotein